jgi:hypothetical protein
VGDLRTAVRRSDDSADEAAAAAAKGSVPGAPGEHLTQEAMRSA